MELEFKIQNGVGVLQIKGRLDASNASQLKTQFIEYLNATTRFVINMEKLEAIDSTGLGAIVSCLKNASEVGGDLKITSLQSKPRMIFEITRAYRIFDIYDSVDSAVESFCGTRQKSSEDEFSEVGDHYEMFDKL